MTKLLVQNKKMQKSSKDGVKVFNFGIPAFRSKSGLSTCPNAGVCAAGCYAKSGAYLWSTVANAYENRLDITLSDSFGLLMSAEITRLAMKNNNLVIRIHDSGDFYNADYLAKLLNVIQLFPTVRFYAYTKMVQLFKGRMLPSNFTVICSLGGKQDGLIDQFNDRHSKVFDSLESLKKAGYLDVSNDDMLIFESKKIGLVYHGVKSYKNTAWDRVAA